MKYLITGFLASLVVSISGCKTVTTQIAPKAAQAINAYCLEPLEVRRGVRAQVNSLISPNQIAITCQGDPTDAGGVH